MISVLSRTQLSKSNDTSASIYYLRAIANSENITEEQYLEKLHNVSNSLLQMYNYTAQVPKINMSVYNSLNKISINTNGELDLSEKKFLLIFASYKAEGGRLQYNEMKIEFLKRKFPFQSYMSPNNPAKNIIYDCKEKICPCNTVCINKNGYILNSEGVNPKNVLINNFHFLSKISKNKAVSDNYNNNFDVNYIIRRTKMRKKKEVIIYKVFEIIPLVGEILALANVEKIKEITDYEFLRREALILKKYLIMWDPNCQFVDHASKLLLNIILCSNEQNQGCNYKN